MESMTELGPGADTYLGHVNSQKADVATTLEATAVGKTDRPRFLISI